MAQFNTPTQAETFARTYCRHCIHEVDCPVMAAHMALLDSDEMDDPASLLHKLITKNPYGDHQCLLFVRRKAAVKVA